MVAFHAGVTGFTGGFVGVDVFFVISGYLITRLLCNEVEEFDTISLAEFYARRIKRLIPAAAAMLAVTMLLAFLLLPPLEIPRVAASIRDAALYVSNEHFRLLSSDYFSGTVRSDPVLHTWSLSVEEQFYFVWPCVILLVWRASAGVGANAGSVARVAATARAQWMRRMRWSFALIAAGSFGASCILGDTSRNAVFFGAAFRAWEFAVGALASTLSARDLASITARPRIALSLHVASVSAVLYAATHFSSATQFPGVATLVPVLGTAALLALGAGDAAAANVVSRALSARPLVWLGRRSYGWYLWHWPLLTFVAAWSAQSSLLTRLTAVIAALGVAALSYRYVESPIRDLKLTSIAPSRVIVTGLSAGLTVVCGTFVLGSWGKQVLADPTRARYVAAVSDLTRLYADGCVNGELDSRVHICEYGPATGIRVALYGDSHAAQWFPALEKLAYAHGWRILVSAKTQCATAMIPSYLSFPPRRFGACERWRRAAADSIAARHPHFVLISNASAYVTDPLREAIAPTVSAEVWRDGLIPLLARFDTLGVRPILVRDTPRLRTDVPTCLSRSGYVGRVGERCGELRRIAINGDLVHAEQAAIRAVPHTGLIDMTDEVCPGEVCLPIVHGYVGYSDVDHLSATLVRAIADPFGAAIAHQIEPDTSSNS